MSGYERTRLADAIRNELHDNEEDRAMNDTPKTMCPRWCNQDHNVIVGPADLDHGSGHMYQGPLSLSRQAGAAVGIGLELAHGAPEPTITVDVMGEDASFQMTPSEAQALAEELVKAARLAKQDAVSAFFVSNGNEAGTE